MSYLYRTEVNRTQTDTYTLTRAEEPIPEPVLLDGHHLAPQVAVVEGDTFTARLGVLDYGAEGYTPQVGHSGPLTGAVPGVVLYSDKDRRGMVFIPARLLPAVLRGLADAYGQVAQVQVTVDRAETQA